MFTQKPAIAESIKLLAVISLLLLPSAQANGQENSSDESAEASPMTETQDLCFLVGEAVKSIASSARKCLEQTINTTRVGQRKMSQLAWTLDRIFQHRLPDEFSKEIACIDASLRSITTQPVITELSICENGSSAANPLDLVQQRNLPSDSAKLRR